MNKIQVEIENCSKCPNFQEKRNYTADSFENVFDWFCTKADKKIKCYVEWNENVKIPEWCPCRIE